MARPIKEGLDYFPIWKPQFITESRFNSSDKKKAYKYLRNSSSAFIKREDVRNFIFNRDGKMCVECGEKQNLQVDHIVSVYRTIRGEFDINKLNTSDNLQTLCGSCNAAKNP
jgi:5-methylcytosine-specific restriction endonuclease McrA